MFPIDYRYRFFNCQPNLLSRPRTVIYFIVLIVFSVWGGARRIIIIVVHRSLVVIRFSIANRRVIVVLVFFIFPCFLFLSFFSNTLQVTTDLVITIVRVPAAGSFFASKSARADPPGVVREQRSVRL